MIVFESKRRRLLLVRVEAGESLKSALLALAREQQITTAWVSGTGSLRRAEVRSVDVDRGGYGRIRTFEGSLVVVSLAATISSFEGALSVEGTLQLSRETDNGVQVFGGAIVDAMSHALELRVECFDDLGLRRELDAETSLPLWVGESRGKIVADAPRATDTGSERDPLDADSTDVSWAMAARASESRSERSASPSRRRRGPGGDGPELDAVLHRAPKARRRTSEDDFMSEHLPEKGDYVDHKQFGLCRVDKVQDDGGLLIRLETGRRKLIKLDYLEVLEPRSSGGKTIYPLRSKKRG